MASPTLSKMKAYIDTVDEAKIIMDSEASDETKYNLLFGSIQDSLKETGLGIPEYCDPDAGYDDDAKAFFDAISSRADEFRKVLGPLNLIPFKET